MLRCRLFFCQLPLPKVVYSLKLAITMASAACTGREGRERGGGGRGGAQRTVIHLKTQNDLCSPSTCSDRPEPFTDGTNKVNPSLPGENQRTEHEAKRRHEILTMICSTPYGGAPCSANIYPCSAVRVCACVFSLSLSVSLTSF